jgi:glutaredoxin
MWGWWKSKRRRPDLYLTLYTRKGCHLCDTARIHLLRWQTEYRFELQIVDIDADSALVERFGKCVPVVTVNDKVRFRGHVNEVLFRRLMEAPSV